MSPSVSSVETNKKREIRKNKSQTKPQLYMYSIIVSHTVEALANTLGSNVISNSAY